MVDILLVSYVLYKLFAFIKGTRAVQLIRGLLLLVIVYYIANNFLQLKIVSWILQSAATMIIVAIPILFQPELRRALSQLGRGVSLFPNERLLKGQELFDLIHILVNSVKQMSEKKMGCLIVLERSTGLNEYVETGVQMDSTLTQELLLTLFHEGTPLHDGAVIVRGIRIIAASVVLPLTDTLKSPAGTYLGTRHRAAIGISEVSDSACLVVSEETGSISLVMDGKLHRNLTEESLNRQLLEIFQVETKISEQPFLRGLLKTRSKVAIEKKKPPVEEETKETITGRIRKFFNVFNLRLAAFFTALVLGLVVLGTPERLSPQNKEVLVPISIKGRPQNLAVALKPSQIRLVVIGKSNRLRTLNTSDIDVYVQMLNHNGSQRLPIGVSLPPGVQLKEYEPKYVDVEVKKQ